LYPVVFRVGGFVVSSFGVMAAVGALAGTWMLRRELAARDMLPALDALGAWLALGGGADSASPTGATESEGHQEQQQDR
jgi:prolipoprotein diacylglyceryltransferase